MNEIYYSDNWLFNNWKYIMKFCSGRTGLYRDIFYNYWLNNFNTKLHNRSIKVLKNLLILKIRE